MSESNRQAWLTLTPPMVEAALGEFYAWFPDVVFVEGDGERLVAKIWGSMLAAADMAATSEHASRPSGKSGA